MQRVELGGAFCARLNYWRGEPKRCGSQLQVISRRPYSQGIRICPRIEGYPSAWPDCKSNQSSTEVKGQPNNSVASVSLVSFTFESPLTSPLTSGPPSDIPHPLDPSWQSHSPRKIMPIYMFTPVRCSLPDGSIMVEPKTWKICSFTCSHHLMLLPNSSSPSLLLSFAH